MRKAIHIICALLIVATMVLPAAAAGFTPSVEQKGAPATVEKDVKVTSLADLSNAPAEVKKAMEDAQKSITEAKSITDIAPAVADVLKTVAPNVQASNLVVRDLFYVSLDKELAKGEEKTITFKAEGITKDSVLIVMVFVDGEWVVIDSKNVEITKDGQVKVTFDAAGPVAFVTTK